MLSFDEALTRLLAAARPVEGVRALPLAAAAERVLAETLVSPIDVPPLANSAMDGYAVRTIDVPVAGTCLPVGQQIAAGAAGLPLPAGSAARIFTGAPIPAGADAVVMQEHCQAVEAGVVVNTVPGLGDHIRPAGEDLAAGQPLLTAGTRLRAAELALIAAAGLTEVPVRRRVRVGAFFTGDELREPGEPLAAGAIYNSNRFLLAAWLERLGCEVRDYGRVADDLPATRATLRTAAAENDLVITSGGVSVGDKDFVKPAVEAEGRLDLWKIAIKPGKPLAFGQLRAGERQAWFVGLPGNPVSCFVTFALLVRPFVLALQGQRIVLPRRYPMPAAFTWGPAPGRTEFLRARPGAAGLELFPNQGSALLTSLAWAEGLACIEPGRRVGVGDLVDYLPFSEVL